MSALRGKRILVTRPLDEAAKLSDRLRDLGAVPLEMPTIETVPLDDPSELDEALQNLVEGDFAWISFSSPRAVDAVLQRLRVLGLPGHFPSMIAAVGPATAARLVEAGFHVHFVADPHTTKVLAEGFPSGRGRVLLPRADIAPPVLEEGLRAKGWTPVRVTAYRTGVSAETPSNVREALDAGAVDAITFTSASTVRGFVTMAGVQAGSRIVCIGPVTAEAAKEAGFRVDAVAEPHTADGLIAALERLFEESSR